MRIPHSNYFPPNKEKSTKRGQRCFHSTCALSTRLRPLTADWKKFSQKQKKRPKKSTNHHPADENENMCSPIIYYPREHYMSKYFFRFHCTTKFPNEFVSNEVARCHADAAVVVAKADPIQIWSMNGGGDDDDALFLAHASCRDFLLLSLFFRCCCWCWLILMQLCNWIECLSLALVIAICTLCATELLTDGFLAMTLMNSGLILQKWWPYNRSG